MHVCPCCLATAVFCRWRGRLNTIVQLGTISGIVVANAINIGTNKWIAGWRISLGLAAVPGTVLLLGQQHSLHPWCHLILCSKAVLLTLLCSGPSACCSIPKLILLKGLLPCTAKRSKVVVPLTSPTALCCTANLKALAVHSGGLFLPETPNSLVERGYLSEAKGVLQKVRGTKDVDVEFDTIVLANEALKGMENPWRAIFRRRNRPQLALAIAMPFFQSVPPPHLFCLRSPCRCCADVSA